MLRRNPPKQLFSEIQLQRHLRNDNIVRLYENFEDEQNIYLVLELCENRVFFFFGLREK